jgi:hypothetical protein
VITVIRFEQKGFDYMIDNKTPTLIGVLLIAAIFIAGCASPSGSAPVQTVVPTTVQTPLPAKGMETPLVTAVTTLKTTTVTIAPVQTSAEKEILHETGILTTKSFKTYDFKDMGFKFIYPGDKFRITIKAEKPVLGYALNTEQATGLQGSQLIPHYESYSKKVQWGLIDPSFVLEKATDSTGEFIYGDYIEYRYEDGKNIAMNKTKGEVHPLTYVVDGRWMSYDPVYDNVQTFNYEITIIKTGGPTKQSFDF